MNYLFLFEEYKTGLFTSKIDNEELTFKLHVIEDPITIVFILLNGKVYDELSVITPQSKYLNKEEFFLNPDINENILETLIENNFIQKTGKVSKAGTKKTYSYQLI